MNQIRVLTDIVAQSRILTNGSPSLTFWRRTNFQTLVPDILIPQKKILLQCDLKLYTLELARRKVRNY